MAILPDEVADPCFIVNNKKLLQAHVDGAILGQSVTQMYTYEVFLWRIPIVLTTNSWDLTRLTEAESGWAHASLCTSLSPCSRRGGSPSPRCKCSRVRDRSAGWRSQRSSQSQSCRGALQSKRRLSHGH